MPKAPQDLQRAADPWAVRRFALLLTLIALAVPSAAQAFRVAEALPAFPNNPVEKIHAPIDGVF